MSEAQKVADILQQLHLSEKVKYIICQTKYNKNKNQVV